MHPVVSHHHWLLVFSFQGASAQILEINNETALEYTFDINKDVIVVTACNEGILSWTDIIYRHRRRLR
jgi:hypothetical protein